MRLAENDCIVWRPVHTHFAQTHAHLSKYPVLTLGDGLGSRVIVYKGCSSYSGEYVVEECDSKDGRVRRLVFLNTPHLAQTEVKLLQGQFV